MKKSNFKTLVVAVDLSEYSKLVVRQAKKMASELDLDPVYVFVYEEIESIPETFAFDKVEVARTYKEEIRSLYGLDKEDRILVRFGKPDKEILAVAKKERLPLVMIGYTSGHGMAKFFLGSVAEKLAATTRVPLWIHRGNKVVLPKKILFPTDLSDRSSKTLRDLAGFKKSLKAEVSVYHVFSDPFPILDFQAWTLMKIAMEEADEKQLKIFKRKNPQAKVVRVNGTVAEAIQKSSKSSDLVVLTPKLKSGLAFGRVTGKIVRSGDIPVLVLP